MRPNRKQDTRTADERRSDYIKEAKTKLCEKAGNPDIKKEEFDWSKIYIIRLLKENEASTEDKANFKQCLTNIKTRYTKNGWTWHESEEKLFDIITRKEYTLD